MDCWNQRQIAGNSGRVKKMCLQNQTMWQKKEMEQRGIIERHGQLNPQNLNTIIEG